MKKRIKRPRYTMIWHGALIELKLSLQEYIVAYIIWKLSKEGTRPFKSRTRKEISLQLGLEKNAAFNVMKKLRTKGIIAGSMEDEEYEPMGYKTLKKWNDVLSNYEYAYGADENKPENMHYTMYWNGSDKELDLSLLSYIISYAIYMYGKKGEDWITLNQKKLAKKINILPSNMSRKLKELIKSKKINEKGSISGRRLVRVAKEFAKFVAQREKDYKTVRGN